MKRTVLALADGTLFEGRSFGATGYRYRPTQVFVRTGGSARRDGDDPHPQPISHGASRRKNHRSFPGPGRR
jgi:hypothetical protein